MNIKIIGSNTNKGIMLKKRVLKAAIATEEKITIVSIYKREEIEKYHFKKYPALLINDKIKIEGDLISTKEILKKIRNIQN